MIRRSPILAILISLSGCYSPWVVVRSGQGSATLEGATLMLELVDRFKAARAVEKLYKAKKKSRMLKRAPYVTLVAGTLTIPKAWRGIYTLDPVNWRCSIGEREVPLLSPEMLKKRFLPRYFATEKYIGLLRVKLPGGNRGAHFFKGVSCLPGETVLFHFFIPRPAFTDRRVLFLVRLVPSGAGIGTPVVFSVVLDLKVLKIRP